MWTARTIELPNFEYRPLAIHREGCDGDYDHFIVVVPDSSITVAREIRDQAIMCMELLQHLNGGERPAWIDDFERLPDSARSVSGGLILVLVKTPETKRLPLDHQDLMGMALCAGQELLASIVGQQEAW